MGIHLDVDEVATVNQARTDVLRKNGLIINTGGELLLAQKLNGNSYFLSFAGTMTMKERTLLIEQNTKK